VQAAADGLTKRYSKQLAKNNPTVTAATISRTRWFKRPWFLVFGVVLLMGAVAFTISESVRSFVFIPAEISIYGITSAQDVDEAAALEAAVTGPIKAVHRFTRNSVLEPNKPPIGVIPGSRMILTQPPLVDVYEIGDRAEQDKVIAAIEAVVRDRKRKPVDLRFMDHENWTVTGNVGQRGPELQLRRVCITRSGTQEQGGTKTITYPVP
jgi:hypothetical protein